jgi:hypothetical protein
MICIHLKRRVRSLHVPSSLSESRDQALRVSLCAGAVVISNERVSLSFGKDAKRKIGVILCITFLGFPTKLETYLPVFEYFCVC